MIRNISFLLIVVLVSACGTLNNSQFSKRKHLKGHFWNLKKNYKNSSSDNASEVYAVSQTDDGVKDEGAVEIRTSTPEDTRMESTPENSVVLEELEESRFESVEDSEEQIDLKPISTERDDVVEANKDEQQSMPPTQGEMTLAAVILILFGLIFWFGVIGLIISLFLKIFSTIIPWLFYTSLIIVGVFVLAFIGIVIFFAFDY